MNDLLREGIITKLKEFSAYIDNELPDYIMVMLANNKTISQINQDLQLFLGDNTDSFTTWLQDVVANPALLKKKGGGARDTKAEKPAGNAVKNKEEPERVSEKDEPGVVGDVPEGRGGRERGRKVEEDERRRSGGRGGVSRGKGGDREEDGSRREGGRNDGRAGEGIHSRMRPRKRIRMDDAHSGGGDEADDHYPPSPKHSKMRSDRYERDREENLRLRERRRSSPEGRTRPAVRKTIRAQPDSTKDQDLRGYIEGGRRQREVESRLRRRDSPMGRRDRRHREGSEEGEEIEEEEMVEVGLEGEEDEEEEEAASTTVASVVRLVDSTRPRRTNEGGSRLLHRAILGLRPQGGVATSTSKRGKVILLPKSVLGDTPPSSVILTKKRMDKTGQGRSRHDISSTHSDNSDEAINQEDVDEEIIVDTRGVELPVGMDAEEVGTEEKLEAVGKDHHLSTPRVGHKIKVVTSTRSGSGRGYVEAEDREDKGLDLRALINRSKEGKTEVQSPRFVVTLGGLDLPEPSPQSQGVSVESTSTVTRKSVKERLGKKPEAPPISTATPTIPAASEVTLKRQEIEHSATPTSMSDLPEKCRFWPNCKNGDKCPYHHPTIPCKLFPDCKYGKKCVFLHPKCKFDSRCTRTDCPYLHTAPRHVSLQQPQNVLPQVISTPIPIISPVFRPPPAFSSNQYNYGSSGPSPRSRSFRYPNKSSLSWKPPQTTSERAFAVPEGQTSSLPV